MEIKNIRNEPDEVKRTDNFTDRAEVKFIQVQGIIGEKIGILLSVSDLMKSNTNIFQETIYDNKYFERMYKGRGHIKIQYTKDIIATEKTHIIFIFENFYDDF